MSEAIIVAIITGGLSLIGAIVSNNRTAQSMDAKLDKQQAVTETKLEDLTREVRAHNNFAQRIPVLEEQIKVANHRIEDLEKREESNTWRQSITFWASFPPQWRQC